MTITAEYGNEGPPTTTLTGVVADQAAWQGLLRRLYSLGLPFGAQTCASIIAMLRQKRFRIYETNPCLNKMKVYRF